MKVLPSSHPGKAPRATKRQIEWTLAFAVCLSAVAIDINIPAIPDVVAHFGAADGSGQHIVAIYLMGYALGQIPSGLLTDRFGRLPVFYLGIGLYTVAAIGTCLANSMTALLVARFVQGLAGASAPVLARATARDLAEGKELARLTSLLVTSLGMATLLAPLLGALLTLFWGWRATFIANVAMGLMVLMVIRLFLHETHPREHRSVQSAWSQLADSARAFAGSSLSLWATALVATTFFAYLAIIAGIGPVAVEVYGMPGPMLGVVFSLAAAFYVGSSQAGRYALRWYSSYQLLRLGFVGYVLSALMITGVLMLDLAGFWWVWWSIIPFLLGMGLIFSNATAIGLAPLPHVAGFAASIMGTTQILMATLGAALTGFFYTRSSLSMLLVVLAGALASTLIFTLGVVLGKWQDAK